MATNGKEITRETRTRSAQGIERAKRKTFPITQRGIKSSQDLSEFHAAALADVDSGAANLKEMLIMRAITGQMIAHENLKLKAGFYTTQKKRSFLS